MGDHPGRTGYPRELRERAAVLRRRGLSRKGIAEDLGVGFSTVARWFREDGVPASAVVTPHGFAEAHLQAVRERWEHQQLEQDGHRDAVGPLTEREVLLVGSALYWAEGTKSKPWRRQHRMTFMNSDPTVIGVYMSYLAALGIPQERVRCTLSIHEGADIATAEAFWREAVGTGVAWAPTSLKRHNPKPSRYNRDIHYRGCLRVDVAQSAATYRRIAGTWEGVAAAMSGARSPVV